jgi:WD40 repeat protein
MNDYHLSLSDLPNEMMISGIFPYLEFQDRNSLSQVNRLYYQLFNEDFLWERLFQSKWSFTYRILKQAKHETKWRLSYKKQMVDLQLFKKDPTCVKNYSTLKVLPTQDSYLYRFKQEEVINLINHRMTPRYFINPPVIEIHNLTLEQKAAEIVLSRNFNFKHVSQIHCNGKHIFIGYVNGKLDMYNLKSKKIKEIQIDTSQIASIQSIGSLVFSGTKNGKIKVWDFERKSLILLGKHLGEVTCLRLIHSFSLMSGSFEGIIKRWDIPCLKIAATWSDHACNGAITVLKVQDFLVASASPGGKNGRICIHDSQTDTCLKQINCSHLIRDLAWDCNKLITIHLQGHLHIIDLNTEKCFKIVKTELKQLDSPFHVFYLGRKIVVTTPSKQLVMNWTSSSFFKTVLQQVTHFFEFNQSAPPSL